MRRSRTLRGWEAELDTLDQARRDASAHGTLVLLRGPRGSGRSTLLAAVRQAWRTAGSQIVDVALTNTDEFGFHAVVRAVQERFEDFGEPRLAAAVAELSRLCSAAVWSRAEQRVSLVVRLGAMLDLLAVQGPVALLVDDADRMAQPAPVLDAVRRPGTVVVAVCTTDTTELATLADVVLDVPPLPAARARTMLADQYGVTPDDGLLAALDAALGPLAGNPATMLAATAELAGRDRLATVHGRLCLERPELGVPLPACWLTDRTDDALLTSIAACPVRIAELPLLAEAAGAEISGFAVDDLVSAGLLEVGELGRLRCTNAALAAALLERAGPAAVVRLRRSLAEVLVLRYRRNEEIEPEALADRVAAVGPHLGRDLALARLLVALAASPDTAPTRAAAWLRAAWWHCDDRRVRTEIAQPWLRALVRAGDPTGLGEAVAAVLRVCRTPSGTLRDDLAAAAVLTAVHLGTPVPAMVERALCAAGERPAALVFAACWFAGGAPVVPDTDAGDQALVSTAELAEVAGESDLVAGFERVLGDRYRAPTHGLAACYHRLTTAYARGDFAAALSAARGVELAGTVDTPTHHLARLWAAEVCLARGDLHQCGSWLAAARPDAFPALRAWVESGLASAREPGGRAAFAVARNGYARVRRQGAVVGLAELLPRLAAAARDCGERRAAHQVLRDVRWLDDAPDPALREAGLLVRALVCENLAAAAAAVLSARARGHRPALMRASVVAGAVGDAPRDRLHEAYELARALDAGQVRATVSALMQKQGVGSPRARLRDGFSSVELRIIESVRAGLTNREIARREHMSEKTIEDHLHRLYARTGCRSRVQLAGASLAGALTGTSVTRFRDDMRTYLG